MSDLIEGRIFQEIVVEYPSINTYTEYIGKPYFSIKYTENGKEFIGYGTYEPEVLSYYLKEYFMSSLQQERNNGNRIDDVISRQAAIDEVLNLNVENRVSWRDAVIDTIDALPSAQPERETGTWIIDSGYPQHCWCSNCNHRFDLFDPKSIHFCPNCGKEMKTCVWRS